MTGESTQPPAPEPEAQSEPGAEPEQPSPGSPAPPTDDSPPDDQGGDAMAKLRRENASWRRKLRETQSSLQAENERLTEQLDAVHRASIESQVTGPGGLVDGADLWLSGVTLDDLRTDDGGVDAEKVKAALEKTLVDHPPWKDRTPRPSLGGGARGTAPSAPSFGEALKDPRRRLA